MRVLLVILALLPVAFCAVWTGKSTDSTYWGGMPFLGKFVFDQGDEATTDGNIHVDVTLPDGAKTVTQLNLVVFSDANDAWSNAYDAGSCTAVFAKMASGSYDHKTLNFNGGNTASLDLAMVGTRRPRSWYASLVLLDTTTDPSNPKALCGGWGSFDFKIHFTRDVSSWNTEFGVDVEGMNTLYIVFFFAYVAFVLVHFYNVNQLSQKLSFVHPIVKMLTFSIFLEFISILVLLIHFGKYTQDGVGLSSFYKFGQIADVLSRVSFILLIMMMAKGWTIAQNFEMTTVGRWTIWIVLALFAIVWISTDIYQFAAEDPALPAEPSGVYAMNIFVLVLGLLLAIWFMYNTFMSWSGETSDEKRSLFFWFGIMYGCFLFSIPLTAFLSYRCDYWVRPRVVTTFNTLINFLGYVCMSALLWHSWSHKFFEINNPSADGALGYEKMGEQGEAFDKL